MILFIGIFLIFLNSKITFSCDNLNIHRELMEHILLHEGDKILKNKFEYSKFGIKDSILKKYNKQYNTDYSIRNLNKNEAIDIGISLMNEYKINQIKSCNLKLIIFDLFYNAGPSAGGLITQMSLNKYNKKDILKEDGIMGSKTIKNLNNVKNIDAFIYIFLKERLKYYSNLKNWNLYKNGWIKRIDYFYDVPNLNCNLE